MAFSLSLRRVLRAYHMIRRKFTHFRKSAYAQIGVHGGKAWFPLCEKLLKTAQIHSLPLRQSFAKLGALAEKRGFPCALKYHISQKCFKRDKTF